MDSGKAIEFDTPYTLLTKTSGIFKEMVQALGRKEFERLLNVALAKENPPKPE